MIRTIYRYEIPVDDSSHVLVAPIDPTGLDTGNLGRCGIVHVACRDDASRMEVWVQVNPDRPLDPRYDSMRLTVTGTGRPAPDEGIYLGTALGPIGAVWHLWRLP